MKLLTFTHANTLKEALIIADKIFGFTFSEGHKCFLLYSTGGAVFPVKESKEEIIKLLKDGEN